MLKNVIKFGLKVFNLRVIHIPTHVMPEVPFDMFAHVLTSFVHQVGPSFRFIQIGASDGVISDNLSPLIRKYELVGCIVEPMPDVYERLKEKYRDQCQLKFSNSIISYSGGSDFLNRSKSIAPILDNLFFNISLNVSKFFNKQVAKNGASVHLEEYHCNVLTLKSIMEELNYEHLHLLYINAKGDDDLIIYHALDQKLHPLIINYVWTKLDLVKNYKLKMRLLDEGYRFLDVGADTICVRQ